MASLFINFVTVAHAQSKDDIYEVQKMLNSLGFSAGIADGLYGAKTDTALTLFFKSISQAYD
ncbi:MAG: peptidoglycan-binding protein, partial [Flammeovirgaceae bacterium]|nr:peptidoglycan-binding protein [Flammeovirgaceae bacterium]